MTKRRARAGAGIESAAGEVIERAKQGHLPEYAVRFVLGALLSCVRLFGTCSPFGAALVGAAGEGMPGAVTLLGSMLSYLFFGGIAWGFRYAATAFLIMSANVVFRKTVLYRRSWFAPLCCSFMMAVTGFPYVIDSLFALRNTALFIMETVLCGGCALFYKTALSPYTHTKKRTDSLPHTLSVLILAVSVASALANVTPVAGISLGRLAACLGVMLIGYRSGATAGCAVGVAAGLVMDASRGYDRALFAVSYAVASLAAAAAARRRKLVFALIYVSVNALVVLWLGGTAGIASLYEAFAASVIFMLIPEGSVGVISDIFGQSAEGITAPETPTDYVRDRVSALSEAFRTLYDSVKIEKTEKETALWPVAERIKEQCCPGCALYKSCWDREKDTTSQLLYSAAEKALRCGKAEKEILPEPLADKCLRANTVAGAIGEELRILAYRRQYKTRVNENKSAAHRQYAEMADILQGIAADMTGVRNAERQVAARVRRCTADISDTIKADVFRDSFGRLRIELTGEDLRSKSKEAIKRKLSDELGIRLSGKSDVADGGKLVLTEAEPYVAAVGVAAVRKRGERVSGDRGTYFKTDDGLFYVILSDGMGSGEGAARESSCTVRILERFLKAGLPAETALSILNSSMQLGSVDEPLCVSVDLMAVDLFTGEMTLYKYGSAPTYVRAGDKVKRIRGVSVSAGALQGGQGTPDMIRMSLDTGSTALILSDGVGTQDDMWIRDIMKNFRGEEKELAREVMRQSLKRNGCEDDMTVLAVTLSEG